MIHFIVTGAVGIAFGFLAIPCLLIGIAATLAWVNRH